MKSLLTTFIFVCCLQLLSCSDTRTNRSFIIDALINAKNSVNGLADLKDKRMISGNTQHGHTLTNQDEIISRFANHELQRDRRNVLECSALNTCFHNANKYIPNCYCDALCSTYDDCCFDSPFAQKKDEWFTHIHEKINRTECYQFNTKTYLTE